MLFVFLILFSGCKKNDNYYEDDNTYLSGRYTKDDKFYDSLAGEYKAYFRMSKPDGSNGGNDVYDTIAVCPIRFGNHADRYVYCKSPVSAFASMLRPGEDRDVSYLAHGDTLAAIAAAYEQKYC